MNSERLFSSFCENGEVMKIYSNTGFQIGFGIGIFIWLILNILPQNVQTTEHSRSSESGFPFTYAHFHGSFNSMFGSGHNVKWNQPILLADILIGIVFCFAIGLFCKTIAESFAHHRKIKQFRDEAKR